MNKQPADEELIKNALERLKKAKTGAYLGPLRLLALEVYDKLNDSGIGCNLLTGEERIYDPQKSDNPRGKQTWKGKNFECFHMILV